jgi:hypothetical protein
MPKRYQSGFLPVARCVDDDAVTKGTFFVLKRLVALSLILLVALAGSMTTMAQPATPDADTAIDEHLAWVLGLFDGGAIDLATAEVEMRFDPAFLAVVPANEFIVTMQQLAGALGPLELVDEQANDSAIEFVGTFESQTGERVMISFAVDPSSELIAGFFITPLDAAMAVATPDALAPGASPVSVELAGAVVDDPEVQIALYQEQVDAIREIGEPVVEAVLAVDDSALEPLLSPEMVAALEAASISDVTATYTTDQVQMSFAEANAHFFGQVQDDIIQGVMMQGGPIPFTLQATEPQSGNGPTGRWDGVLSGIGLEISVVFDGDEGGNLTAALDIPAQNVTEQPLSNVSFTADRPIGDLIEDRAFAPGGINNGYSADHGWGDALMRISVGVDIESGTVTGLQLLPAMLLPDDPAAGQVSETSYRLPFDGTWWTFWGGESELQNYHTVSPSQRHAYDFVIWNDGATFSGDGTRNEDYWAWGQAVLAPAGGTVVAIVNDEPDLPPNAPLEQRAQVGNPGGNHVAIETGDDEYVFIAHMQEGTVEVEAGDEVQAGDLLGLTGNSGNSSEPHIHIHAQDSPDLVDPTATGLPIRFASAVVDGDPVEDAMPVQGSFVANP